VTPPARKHRDDVGETTIYGGGAVVAEAATRLH